MCEDTLTFRDPFSKGYQGKFYPPTNFEKGIKENFIRHPPLKKETKKL